MQHLIDELYAAGHKTFEFPIERLIVFLRIILTIFCLYALITTPVRAIEQPPLFELILAAYIFFGLIIATLLIIGRYRTGWQLPVHLVDIGFISVLLYFSPILSNTFFILYIFVLLSATYRWNFRGALFTTIALLVLQTILFVLTGAKFQYTIQFIFLSTIGGMFAFFGLSRERSAERLSQIASWPKIKAHSYNINEDRWLDSTLTHIANVLRAPRVLVLWEIAQEPYTCMALFVDGKCKLDRITDHFFHDLVSEEFNTITFASDSIRSKECLTSNGIIPFVNPIVNTYLQDRFNISSVCSAEFSGEICNGRVFILDRSDWIDDDLTLVEFVASRLRIELEFNALSIQLEEDVATRERIRLARDLHDGVLQSLTAAGLQLKSIASHSAHKVRLEIEGVRKLLLNEQKSIRAFVDERQSSLPSNYLILLDALKSEIGEIKRQWHCSIALSVAPQDAIVSTELIRQLEYLISEATANAVRHGKASHITIMIEHTPSHVKIVITDNGTGMMGKTGAYSQTELAALGIGPQSISKRIAELGGTLVLSSSPKGVELCIEIPCKIPLT